MEILVRGGRVKQKRNTGTSRHITTRWVEQHCNTYVNEVSFTQTKCRRLKCRNDPWPLPAEHHTSSWHHQAACECSAWRRWGYQQPHSRHQVTSSSQSPAIHRHTQTFQLPLFRLTSVCQLLPKGPEANFYRTTVDQATVSRHWRQTKCTKCSHKNQMLDKLPKHYAHLSMLGEYCVYLYNTIKSSYWM